MEDKKNEITILNTDIEQPQKEENNPNNKEQKQYDNDDKKKTLKIIITTIICTLLFIVTLLLLILLGLKKCSNQPVVISSSEPTSSEPKYNYDNAKLNNVFKTIVKNQVYVDMGIEDHVDEILAINYTDIDNKFSLDIDARIEDRVYYYHTKDVEYSNHETFVEYLLTLDTVQTLPLITTGEETNISWLDKTEEKLATEIVGAHYVISSSASPKYLSGFYFNNPTNEYYVYQKIELTNTDGFPSNPSIKIGLDSPLYGYYQLLNQ